MKRPISILATATLLALAVQSALAADVQVKVPSTPEAARAADLIARAQHALIASLGADEHIRTLWIFPTGEANTVFVHYSSSAAGEKETSEHLAFIEMRGKGIARLQDLTSAPATMVAGAKVQPSTPATARVSPGKSRS
jgi:hypothetical protein